MNRKLRALLERVKKGLATSRWPLILGVVGAVLVVKLDILGTLFTDLMFTTPLIIALSWLTSKVLWDSWWKPHGFDLRTDPWIAITQFGIIYIGACLLVG